MLAHILLLILFCTSSASLLAQNSNLGLPFVQNHLKETYGAATQNWEVDQDFRGVMYFANNDGLLSFDGNNWETHSLPNRTIARSLAIDQQGRVFVGGQDELGFFLPDERGFLRFHSILHLLPDSLRHMEDVWDLFFEDEALWFRTSRVICRLLGEEVLVFRPVGEFGALEFAGGKVFAFDSGRGLLRWEAGTWRVIPGSEQLLSTIVTSVILHDSFCWISTVRHGLWHIDQDQIRPLSIPVNDLLRQQRLHAMLLLPNGNIAIGTARSGLVILDQQGRPVSWVHRDNGLQNNHILSLFIDRSDNLWAGLNHGIDYLETSSAYRRILTDPQLEGAGYAIENDGRHWWFGTANGLYRIPFSGYYDPFQNPGHWLVPGSEGQVWGLAHVGEDLMVGHHEGGFQARDRLDRIATAGGSSRSGFWNYIEVPGHPSLRVAGTYQGLILLREQEGRWTEWKKIPGLEESCRLMVSDGQRRVWVAHPYRGVFSVDFSAGPEAPLITRYGQAEGLPDDHFNHVFSVFGEVLFGTVAGVYAFDDRESRFVEKEVYRSVMGKNGWVKVMKEGPRGQVWFVMDDRVGYLQIEDSGLAKSVSCHWLPRLSDRLVKGHEMLFPLDEHHVLAGVDNGFVRFDPMYVPPSKGVQADVKISAIWLLGETDSLLFGGNFSDGESVLLTQPEAQIPQYAHDQHTFRFEVAASRFHDKEGMEFRFWMQGMDQDWQAWGKKAEKEYTRLRPGKYQLQVQARDSYGEMTAPLLFSFTILPPWYASNTAKTLYGFVGLLIFLGLLLIPQRKYKEETKKLKEDMEKKDASRQQEILELKTSSLHAEIQHQNRELASSTMHLVQKNEILAKVRSELDHLIQETKDSQVRTRIRGLLRLVSQDEQLDRDWEQFAYHFDQVHVDFLKRLSEEYPLLTPKDHRLCAYLRMNLSSKEIAPLMNISVRGIEISRYRLRKKLGLDHDANLNEFMMRY